MTNQNWKNIDLRKIKYPKKRLKRILDAVWDDAVEQTVKSAALPPSEVDAINEAAKKLHTPNHHLFTKDRVNLCRKKRSSS